MESAPGHELLAQSNTITTGASSIDGSRSQGASPHLSRMNHNHPVLFCLIHHESKLDFKVNFSCALLSPKHKARARPALFLGDQLRLNEIRDRLEKGI